MTELDKVQANFMILEKLCAFLAKEHIPSVPVILLDELETLYIGLLPSNDDMWATFAAQALEDANLAPFCEVMAFSSEMGGGIKIAKDKLNLLRL